MPADARAPIRAYAVRESAVVPHPTPWAACYAYDDEPPAPDETEAWIVLAPHDQPPVPADVADQRERAAFEAGFMSTEKQGISVAAAYAAYRQRQEAERGKR